MNYTVEFIDGVAEVKCERSFTFEDAVDALTEVVNAPYREDIRALLVLDEGSAFSPTREGLRTITGLMDQLLELEGVVIAIVVSKVVHYGIGRVTEVRAGHGSGRVRVFLKEEAARQWIAEASPQTEG